MLWRDCECVAEGAVRKVDGQIGIEHEDAFADRLHEVQWVNVTHVSGSSAPPDRETHPQQQECDLASGIASALHQT
jgi:hypothetical protein